MKAQNQGPDITPATELCTAPASGTKPHSPCRDMLLEQEAMWSMGMSHFKVQLENKNSS